MLFILCGVPSLRRRDQTDERLQWSLAQWEVAVNNVQNAPEAVWPPLDVLNGRCQADQRHRLTGLRDDDVNWEYAAVKSVSRSAGRGAGVT